ncbi:hypothetical protein [Lacisediminihabitans profunda]|uniref:Uncharacterized protein n=1 Tax=Lacisediminihabitans profunda TaxID=2594790 RepID=A0A5C8UN25_9MICO|nr:hypothetical protein [Lacisediminihabitans profunda]TXN29311.1 hypothetical protein FVP33_14120 [Lacisediminihabitans profunda]
MSEQRDAAWVKGASPEEVSTAYEAGDLREWLAQPNVLEAIPAAREGQRGESWVRAATPEQVEAARHAGELDDLMGIVRNEAGNTAEDLLGSGH